MGVSSIRDIQRTPCVFTHLLARTHRIARDPSCSLVGAQWFPRCP
jgi:hypothetical protein